METETSKKNIYFNFGPEESYFLRCGAQHRSFGDIAGKPGGWTDGQWVKFDCVAWKYPFYFASRHSHDRVNKIRMDNPPKNPPKTPPDAPNILERWVQERKFSPLRFIIGEKKGSWFVWMLHGDFLAGCNTPERMTQAVRDLKKSYTSVRCAALGTNETWILIWEDGELRYNLKNEYPGLSKKLEKFGKFQGDDVSWVALNPFRAGDYFLYEEKKKTASFQVSEAFGDELNDVLIAEGVTTTDVVLRRQELVKSRQVIDLVRDVDLVRTATETVGFDSSALSKAVVTVAKTGLVIAKVGVAIAGVATCNVM